MVGKWGITGLALASGLAYAPARAQVTQRASVADDGHAGNAASSAPSVNADARLVAFASAADDLVPGDGNGVDDVFVRDRLLQTTIRVSVSSSGEEANGASYTPAISAGGRFVLFGSDATNLVAGDGNGRADLFLRDLELGTTEIVGLADDESLGNGDTRSGVVSADGRWVAFSSAASNLVPFDTNGVEDVFRRDRVTGTTLRVSLATVGLQANAACLAPAMSDDGRYIAFHSAADDLVTQDQNGFVDVFLRDVSSSTTERVSIGWDGSEAAGAFPSLSRDGRFVCFESDAPNVVPGDANLVRDVFLRDRSTGETRLVSVASDGTPGDQPSTGGRVSSDGRFVAFTSFATTFAPGGQGVQHAYLHDNSSATTERVSISTSGAPGNASTYGPPGVSKNGRFVAFESFSSNLVASDLNAAADVFVRDRDATSFTLSCSPGVAGTIACPCGNPAAGPGRGCDNSASTGGATIAATGQAYLGADTLRFTTAGELATATSILLQGDAFQPAGTVFGQGVRCAGGALKRLYVRAAASGSISVPNPQLGDPSVSARSAALGDPLQAGVWRYYLVYYRDPVVLGGCPALSTFNATPTGGVSWWP